MPSSVGANRVNVPMRMPQRRQEQQGGAPGYGGGRPIPAGSRRTAPGGRVGPPIVTPSPSPAVGKGAIAMREPVDLEEPDLGGPPIVPPGQGKKSGLPFGWHYDAQGEPMRNTGQGAGLKPSVGGFRQPRARSRVPMRRTIGRRKREPGFGQGAF